MEHALFGNTFGICNFEQVEEDDMCWKSEE